MSTVGSYARPIFPRGFPSQTTNLLWVTLSLTLTFPIIRSPPKPFPLLLSPSRLRPSQPSLRVLRRIFSRHISSSPPVVHAVIPPESGVFWRPTPTAVAAYKAPPPRRASQPSCWYTRDHGWPFSIPYPRSSAAACLSYLWHSLFFGIWVCPSRSCRANKPDPRPRTHPRWPRPDSRFRSFGSIYNFNSQPDSARHDSLWHQSQRQEPLCL